MKKIKKPRPVIPCWNCQSVSIYPVHVVLEPQYRFSEDQHNIDSRDVGWFVCTRCGATARENPTSLGPGPKVMPWGTTKIKGVM